MTPHPRRARANSAEVAPLRAMPYEPGTVDCHRLIDCKAHIQSVLQHLVQMQNTEHIQAQLVSVHNQLEGLHDLQRVQRQGS